MNQEEGPVALTRQQICQPPNLGTPQPPELWERKFCHLSCPVYGIVTKAQTEWDGVLEAYTPSYFFSGFSDVHPGILLSSNSQQGKQLTHKQACGPRAPQRKGG